MLNALVRNALKYRAAVAVSAMLILILGGAGLLRAQYDVFPEFVPNQAVVQTEAPGFSAEQVEQLVTQPLENVINGAAAIDAVRSESIAGLSVITVVFKDASDPYRDRQVLTERMAAAMGALPQGVHAPALEAMTSSTMDLLKIGFVSRRLTPVQLRTLVEWTIRPHLLSVAGVARANVYGGGVEELQIAVRPEALASFGLSLTDVLTAARGATAIRGAGYVDTPNQRVVIDTRVTSVSPESLSATVITQQAGRNITLSDVATVQLSAAPAFGDALVQAEHAVLLTLSSQYGANTLDVTRRTERALNELLPALQAQGVTVYPAIHRPASFIERALANMELSLLIGGVLVLVILLAFLRDWRTALISFITIPLSLLIAVLIMNALGWTINTMTLGGLAVALGIVVDDAIIDVENIARRLRQAMQHPTTAVESLILMASLEVRRPIVLATLVVGLVFVPILTLPGLQGSFFAPLAASFLLATFASLLVALTVTPALCALLLQRVVRHREPRWLRKLKVAHRRLIWHTLSHTRALWIGSAVVGVVALLGFLSFGTELLPPFREGHFVMQMFGPAGTSLAEMTRLGERISKQVLAIDGVKTISQQVGRAEAGEDTWRPDHSEFHIELASGLAASEQSRIEAALHHTINGYPGVQSEILTFLGDRIGESLSGETAPVAVSVYGPDLVKLDEIAAHAAALLTRLAQAKEVRIAASPQLPTMQVELDARRLAAFGLRAGDVLDAIGAANPGEIVNQIHSGIRSIDIRVRLDSSALPDPESIAGLRLRRANGQLLSLSTVADVSAVNGRSSISHQAGQRRQVITLTPSTADVVSFVAVAQRLLTDKLQLPPGYYIEFSGTAQGAIAARRDLLLHSTLAAAAIIALLLLAFSSLRSVVLIVANIPFALIGGVIAVALTGSTLSIGALVGFVTLFGISARNSILLIAHYEHLVQQEGMRWNRYASLRGVRERLTPITMTALVTAIGLLPLAFGSGEAGREIEGPMAIVILGGLLSSTVLNLLVLPAIAARYLRLESSSGRAAIDVPDGSRPTA